MEHGKKVQIQVNTIAMNAWQRIESVHPGMFKLEDVHKLTLKALRNVNVQRAFECVFSEEAVKRHNEKIIESLRSK